MENDFSFLKEKENDYFHVAIRERFGSRCGLDEAVIDRISRDGSEPGWLRDLRHAAFAAWKTLDMPGEWAPESLGSLDFGALNYYDPLPMPETSQWKSVADPIRQTFETLGVRGEEESFLGGLKAQFDSNVVFGSLNEALRAKGILFVDSVSGLRDHPDIFRKYFGSLIGHDSNKLAALNTAVFTGGAFLYVPPGVKVGMPLKSYFRINEAGCGQFGRTLIILGEESELVFMEGCSAANHSADSLHASVGEIIAGANSNIQYITFQNWSRSIFNLVQMRSIAHPGAHVKWLDCNIGGKLTMKYPSTILAGENSRSEIISIGFAVSGQIQDTGGKMEHQASGTRSSIVSKSISVGKGCATYRGLIHIDPKARHCMNNTECDALLIDSNSRTNTYPSITISGNANSVQHEASVSKISSDQIFYMRQRGLPEDQAVSLGVNGFINELVREFPLEYSAPLRRLIDLEMEGTVG